MPSQADTLGQVPIMRLMPSQMLYRDQDSSQLGQGNTSNMSLELLNGSSNSIESN